MGMKEQQRFTVGKRQKQNEAVETLKIEDFFFSEELNGKFELHISADQSSLL